MDIETAQVVVALGAGSLGFAFVLAATRDIIGDDTPSKVAVIVTMGVVGLILSVIVGAAIKDLPQMERPHSVDDVGAYVAGVPWHAIDSRLGESFSGRALFAGAIAGIGYELSRHFFGQRRQE